MKNEGTSRFYVPDAFPAVPDMELTWMLIQTAREMTAGSDRDVYVGITSSDDAFYGESPEFIENLRSYKVMNLDMESSALYTVAHMRGVRAATHQWNLRQSDQCGGHLYQEKRTAAKHGRRRFRSCWRQSTAWSSKSRNRGIPWIY